MDFFSIIPGIAEHLGVAPSALVFWVLVINVVSRVVARRIPDDAVGFWGFVRQLAAILGAEVSSRVTEGVTVKDVVKQTMATPPITEKVAAATGEDPAVLLQASTTEKR